MEAEVPRAGCAIKIKPFIPVFDTLFCLCVMTVSVGQGVQEDHFLRDGGGQELDLVENMGRFTFCEEEL